MGLPADHPQRGELNDEVHARPPMPMIAPLAISYLALVTDGPPREAGHAAVRALAERYGVAAPAPAANHHSMDLGHFRLRWESHTEFNRFMVAAVTEGRAFEQTALALVPADWVCALPGRLMVAAHVALLPAPERLPDPADVSLHLFDGNPLIGAEVAAGAAIAFTDFRIHGDRFSRILLLDRSMGAFQAGRMVQRILEIETYRMMALLALGVARELTPFLSRGEQELAEVARALVVAREEDEPALHDRLSKLEAAMESREADNLYRFSAARAYDELVRRRIGELRESRIEGLQTFREFTERRLAPAMDTCRAVAARQESLSERVARATQLLSARVELTRETQAQKLLESMDRRARLQLRLQAAVETVSVAAVTYYVVGLVSYAAKGLHAFGLPLEPELIIAGSVPLAAMAAFYAAHRTHRIVSREQ